MAELAALRVALGCFRQPARLAAMRRGDLPPGMVHLLHVAAGDDAVVADLAPQLGVSAPQLGEASRFFLQQVLTSSRHDPYRALGLNRDASETDIRTHRRLLLKWLHPDRNRSPWEAALFQRVMKASAALAQQPTFSQPAADHAAAQPLASTGLTVMQTAVLRMPPQAGRRRPVRPSRDWAGLGQRVLLAAMGLGLLLGGASVIITARSKAPDPVLRSDILPTGGVR